MSPRAKADVPAPESPDPASDSSLLAGHDYILEVERDWDFLVQVRVRFLRTRIFAEDRYYIFVGDSPDLEYWLTARDEGQSIDGVLARKSVTVLVGERDTRSSDAGSTPPRAVVTGVLRLVKPPAPARPRAPRLPRK